MSLGVPGTNGTDGVPGVNGEDGVPGVNGTDGFPGVNGTDGVPGVNGTDGVPGVNGRDGSPGPRGKQLVIKVLHSSSQLCAYIYVYSNSMHDPSPYNHLQGHQGNQGNQVQWVGLHTHIQHSSKLRENHT